MAKEKAYKADNLVALEGLEAVRLRPGMYIGTTGSKGFHHLLWEIVDNAIDEASNNYADTVEVTINSDGSVSVYDNGRGIPVDKNKKLNMNGVEVVFTKLHAGGKFDNNEYKFSGGLHGVGSAVVNALSRWCTVEVFRDKKHYKEEFHSIEEDGHIKSGIIKKELEVVGVTKLRGTKITFLPDDRMFVKEKFDFDTVNNRLEELAYLNKGLTIKFTDKRRVDEEGVPFSVTYRFSGGISDYIRHLTEPKTLIEDRNKVVYLEKELDTFALEVAIQYTEYTAGEQIYSYVNNIPTGEGGTHETGLRTALTKCLGDYAKDRKLVKDKDAALTGEDLRAGLIAVLSIKMQNVQFEGQTKTKLGNPEAKTMVDSIVTQMLSAFLADKKNRTFADAIIKNAQLSAKEREAVKQAKIRQRNLNEKSGAGLIGKFCSCTGKDVKRNELFIVEGDSAGGTTKQARDRRYQAVLPLRGKPLNAEKTNINALYKNEEFLSLINALGADCGPSFKIENLKFDKVIILADADVDGYHIRSLLLTFFYRYMRKLISDGHVYIGMPPLYQVSKKDDKRYAYDDNELDKVVAEFKTGYKIQRYKGLGEMDADQLRETTLDPKDRTLMRVTLDDAAQAEYVVSVLMGEDVKSRRQFIYNHANFNKDDEFADKYGG